MIEQDIMRDTAELFGITVEDLKSRSRKRRFVDARIVVSYMIYGKDLMTSTETGMLLNRTHATILHFERQAKNWIERPILNDRVVKAIMELEKKYP